MGNGAHFAYGYISSVLPEEGKARVRFPQFTQNEDKREFVTKPLPVLVSMATAGQDSFPLAENDHVCCIMEDGSFENGVILGAIYDKYNKPTGAASGKRLTRYNDGSTISYDTNTSTYEMDMQGPVNIKSTGTITFNDGANNGIPKVVVCQQKYNRLESDNNFLKSILQSVIGGSPIPEPGSGAPSALQAALALALAAYWGDTLTLTTQADLEDTAVKH